MAQEQGVRMERAGRRGAEFLSLHVYANSGSLSEQPWPAMINRKHILQEDQPLGNTTMSASLPL